VNDWIDATLKARPVVDDGFADRVIAIGRAQDRTRFLLRLLVAVLALGMVAAAVGGLALHTIERLQGQQALFGTFATPAMREEAFVRDWQRLAGHPALRRTRGGEAADARLAPIARLLDDQVAGRPCRRSPIADDCDTAFLVGMRHFSHLDVLPGHVSTTTWGTIVRGHLARAAAVDGPTFAAAVDDAHAFVRLLLAHRGNAAGIIAGITHEIEKARASGQDTGGATPLFSTADADRLAELWWEAPVFLGAEASPATRELVADSPSVIACGARRDAPRTLDSAIAFATDDAHRSLLRRVADDADGCAAREPLPARHALCDNPDGALCTAYVTTLQLPGVRGLFVPLLSPPPRHWEVKE
jgi:hypothetical protein